MFEYIRATDLDQSEIAAGLEDGTLQFWRTDSVGQKWLKRTPPLRAIPNEGFDDSQIQREDDEEELGDE